MTSLRALLAALAALVAIQPATATITGQVTLTIAKAAPLATSPYGRRGVAPKQLPSVPDIQKVIVFVTGIRPQGPPPPMRARIAQRNEQFVPPVIAITTGSTVDFPNDDPFFHNVFSLSKALNFNLGKYPSGSSKARTFPRPGIVKVFCDLHSQMSATIMVLDHPWFTMVKDDGSFTLPPVPAGELTVVAWHERIGERRETVRLSPGETARLSFTLPVLESQP